MASGSGNDALDRTPQGWFRMIETRLKRVEHRLGRYIAPADSGWFDLTGYLLAGFTTTSFQGRTIGREFLIRGSIVGTFPIGTTNTDFAAGLPTSLRPASTTIFDSGYMIGMPVTVFVRAAGTMAVTNRVAVEGSQLQFTLRGYID